MRRQVVGEHVPLAPIDQSSIDIVDRFRHEPVWLHVISDWEDTTKVQLPPVFATLDDLGQVPISVIQQEDWRNHRATIYTETELQTDDAVDPDDVRHRGGIEARIGLQLDGTVPGLRVVRRDRSWPRNQQIIVDIHTSFHGTMTFELIAADNEQLWRRASPADVAQA